MSVRKPHSGLEGKTKSKKSKQETASKNIKEKLEKRQPKEIRDDKVEREKKAVFCN